MGIVKVNPNLVNHVFNDFFKGANPTQPRNNFRGTLPAVNVKETEDEFELELAAPGLAKDEFKIEVNEGVLTISSTKEVSKEEQKTAGYTRKEFSFGSFSRRFTLPEDADDQSISAKYNNGILHVVLPKKEEAKPQPARLVEIA